MKCPDILIVSDLHLGCEYLDRPHLAAFLTWVPHSATLILNGDTIDTPRSPLTAPDEAILQQLRDHAARAPVIWIEGNHDRGFRPESPGAIRFVRDYVVESADLYVAHGSFFDNVMPYHRWFIRLFRFLHNWRIRLGASPVHVAEYAKRWQLLYKYLRKTVMLNAVEHCRETGHRAVACGHVHYPEHRVIDGIDYINTGAWTEKPACFAAVTDGAVELLQWHDAAPPPAPLRALAC